MTSIGIVVIQEPHILQAHLPRTLLMLNNANYKGPRPLFQLQTQPMGCTGTKEAVLPSGVSMPLCTAQVPPQPRQAAFWSHTMERVGGRAK